MDRPGVIGLPVAECELKLVPNAGKLEVRVRGPNVMPGYYKREDLTQAAFDEEGFYRIGDAVRPADPDDPAQGIVFDGRLAEEFKLTTGTWVPVGELRVGVLAAASPVLQDAIVAGENRGFIGLLAWLNAAGCQQVIGSEAPQDLAQLAVHPRVRAHVREAVARWNAKQTGASHRIERVLLLPDAPSIDANEITDKGYINQRLALERRRAEVERLFAAEPDAEVIVLGR
jgi:feruloyl-CoA synthase